MFHRASTPISIGETVLDESPTIITRFAEENGCRITGGWATLGMAIASVSRSLTSCRARSTSVPGSNVSTIEDNPGTDFEWIDFSHGVPFSSSSRLSVTRSSTSGAERPSASVCTSMTGGANSGVASTGIDLACWIPSTTTPAATASTTSLKRRLAVISEVTMSL